MSGRHIVMRTTLSTTQRRFELLSVMQTDAKILAYSPF